MSYLLGPNDRPAPNTIPVAIPPPPKIERPAPEGRLDTAFQDNKAIKAQARYDELFMAALQKYEQGAMAHIPQAALDRDGGAEWGRQHQLAFAAANPMLKPGTPGRPSAAPFQHTWHQNLKFSRAEEAAVKQSLPTRAEMTLWSSPEVDAYRYQLPFQR